MHLLRLLPLLLVHSLQAQVILSEFMANNQSTLQDNFGQYEDWIEIANLSPAPVNLANWALTDDAQEPFKWRFPDIPLAPGDSLLVFASNRDLRDPFQPLHTNFRLNDQGEFLALTRPDGAFATQFAPAYPPQIPDLSFGFGQELRLNTNLTHGAVGTLHLPTSDSLGRDWTRLEFDDSSWPRATNGLGFDTRQREDLAGGAPHAVWDLQPTGFWRLTETNGLAAANDTPLGPAIDLAPVGDLRFGVAGPRPPPFLGFEEANHATAFNGTDAYLETPYHPALNPPQFTLSCWVRLTGGQGHYRSPVTSRVGQGGQQAGYILYATPGDTWELWTGSGNSWNVLPGGPVTYSQWTHLAGTYDGAILRLYTNGLLANGRDFSFRSNDRYPFRVGSGATEGAGSYYFAGDVDEVAFFNRPLSSQEILRLFQSATNGLNGGSITNAGPSPFAPLIATDLLASMPDHHPGAYLRLPFVLPHPHPNHTLNHPKKKDDRILAYQNGLEVRDGATTTAIANNELQIDGLILWNNGRNAEKANTIEGQSNSLAQPWLRGESGIARRVSLVDPVLRRPLSYSDPDHRPDFASPALSPMWAQPPDDGFFDQWANWLGAFGSIEWTEEWADFIQEEDIIIN